MRPPYPLISRLRAPRLRCLPETCPRGATTAVLTLAFACAPGPEASLEDAGLRAKDGGVFLDASGLAADGSTPFDAGITDARDSGQAGDARDASTPDAEGTLDSDGDFIPDDEDPAPARPNVALLRDTFDTASSEWIFSSVSMAIDPEESMLTVRTLEPFVREGWIGPRPQWGDYYVRSLIQVSAVGHSSDASSGRAGVIVRVNQVSPDRYLSCSVDMKRGLVLLTEHEGGGPSGTTLASAPIPITLGRWIPLNFQAQGSVLRCSAAGIAVTASSPTFFSGSVGFRTFDATFAADWLEVYAL